MRKAEILIIGVIYNTYPETLRYLESIALVIEDQTAVILIDNSSISKPEGFFAKISSYPFLTYIKTGENLGYFGGARHALKNYLAMHAAYPEWILVTNVDIVFTPGFLRDLKNLSPGPDLGVIAPSIISYRWKTDYNPKVIERYTRKKLQFYLFLYSSFLVHNLFLIAAYAKKWLTGLRKHKNDVSVSNSQPIRKIYAPHGSCLVFHRNYFTRGGNLDLLNFLFGEEILVAECARKSGLDIEYHPELVIHDHEHASTGFFVTPGINMYNRQAIQAIIARYYS